MKIVPTINLVFLVFLTYSCRRPVLSPDQRNTVFRPPVLILRNPNLDSHTGIDGRIFQLVLNTDQFNRGDLLISELASVSVVRVLGWEIKQPQETTYRVCIWPEHPYRSIPKKAMLPGVRCRRYYPLL